jgi:hypothetical protein
MEGSVADLVATSSAANYKQRKLLLTRMKKKSKSNTKLATAKMIYVKEQSIMLNSSLDITRELSSMLESLLVQDYAGRTVQGEHGIVELIKTMVGDAEEQENHGKGIIQQLRDVKEMISGVGAQKSKSRAKQKQAAAAAATCQTREVDKENATAADGSGAPLHAMERAKVAVAAANAASAEMEMDSMVAQLLVSMRDSHENEGARLAAEEQTLTKEVAGLRKSISSMLREDHRGEEEKQLRRDLALRENDSIETQLFMEDWFAKVRALDDNHAQALHVHVAAADEARGVGEGELAARGAWTPDERQLFSKVFLHAEMGGMHTNRPRLMTALRTQLPDKNEEQIDAYEQHFLSCRTWSRRRKELVQNHTLCRAELLSTAGAALESFRKEQQLAQEHEREVSARAELQALLHAQLVGMRAVASENQRLVDEARAHREALAQVEQSRADIARQEEFNKKKVLIESFRAARKAADDAATARAKASAQDELERVQLEVEKSRPNVERRQRLLDEKAADVALKEQVLQEEAERRLMFLQRLADSVKPDVGSRLEDTTKAADSHGYLGAPEDHRGHISMRGFDNNKLFKDARFRLGVYLHEAGVAKSVVSKVQLLTATQASGSQLTSALPVPIMPNTQPNTQTLNAHYPQAVVRDYFPRADAPLPTIW